MVAFAQRRILGLTLREHIGGRWAISWVLFVFNVPLNLLAITTNISQTPEGGDWVGWFIVAMAGLATIGILFLLGDFVLFRHRSERPLRVWVVVLFGFLIGAVRAIVVVVVADALGLQTFTVPGLLGRMMGGGVLGAVVLPLGALVLSVTYRYRSERRRLLDELADRQRQSLIEEDEVRVLRTAVVDGVRQEVLDVALSVIDRGGGPREVSAALRETSHSLWLDKTSVPDGGRKDFRVVSVLWQALTTHTLPVVWICLLWGVSAAGTVVRLNGWVVGSVQLVFCLLALGLCLALANRWIRRRPRQWVLATGLMVFIAWTVTSPVSYVIFDDRPIETAIPTFILNFFWLPLVVGLTALAVGALTSSEIVLERIRVDIGEADVTRRAVEVERESILRELAEQLHGTVHSPFVSRVALGGDREDLVEQVGEAVASLGYLPLTSSLEDRVVSIAESWDGLLAVDVVVEGGWTQTRNVERVVREALANAYRHGGASTARVFIRDYEGSVRVIVEDNGLGPSSGSSAGLGSRMFDTLGEWSIARESSSTVFVMDLPV